MAITHNFINLFVASFDDQDGVQEALLRFRACKMGEGAMISEAVQILKDNDGKLHIVETIDLNGPRGDILGGVTGGIIAMAAGQDLVVPAAVNAVMQGAAAWLANFGFSNLRMNQMASELPSGSTMLVIVTENSLANSFATYFAADATDLVIDEINLLDVLKIEAVNKAVYLAVSADEGVDICGDEIGFDLWESSSSRFKAGPEGISVDTLAS